MSEKKVLTDPNLLNIILSFTGEEPPTININLSV